MGSAILAVVLFKNMTATNIFQGSCRSFSWIRPNSSGEVGRKWGNDGNAIDSMTEIFDGPSHLRDGGLFISGSDTYCEGETSKYGDDDGLRFRRTVAGLGPTVSIVLGAMVM